MTDTAGKTPEVFQQKGEQMNFFVFNPRQSGLVAAPCQLCSPSPQFIHLSICSEGKSGKVGFLFPFSIQETRGKKGAGEGI